MQLSYQKLGSDHPMFGKVEYLVADGTQPICYKTASGYIPLEEGAAQPAAAPTAQAEVNTRTLYVLSFQVNGEAEEQTFTSKKKLDKAVELYQSKEFISDIATKEYQILLD
ncbi:MULTISPECIES: hypothetical protein [Thiomicrorhabdus]|uniref:Uncharacterized protein n=1 Tax=Thiomicrorhabdus heinhorstiae TaxID=2748010 RepID=A0ABS0C0V6_9GAMM|nr:MULTISPECIES: hypothetical protein [Thiomicrorhabdus]MBF6058925.1 hypothetical protein [Thiomicrorhabdus heinhorstiae]